MTKARTLADFISDGSPLADGTISVSEVSGAAPLANPTFTGNIDAGDNVKIRLGDSDDLLIYHDGSNSYIDDAGTGDLYLRSSNDLLFTNADGSETYARFQENGYVRLFYDNALKFATSSTGVDITGDVGADTATITGKTTTDELDLNALAATISDTAVDVFVYDTSKDSDGGAWRKRTQGTSWYQETLNTATRGSRKEFPSVAVIVVHSLSTTGKVTIYDGDDPSLPMWMVLSGSSSALDLIPSFSGTSLSCVSALNGIVMVGNGTYDIDSINFVEDAGYKWSNSSKGKYNGNIEQRADGLGFGGNYGSGIVNRAVNDVAMTVLPNAPIDAATGLPVPTIAVATDGGVSVIKDDGTVESESDTVAISGLTIVDNKYLQIVRNSNTVPLEVMPLLSLDTVSTRTYRDDGNNSSSYPSLISGLNPTGVISPNAIGGSGLVLIDEDYDSVSSNTTGGMVAYVTSSYNSGYQNGDIKLATLSDTDDTDVTGSELVTNGTFDSDTSGWTLVRDGIGTAVQNSGTLVMTSDGSKTYMSQQISVESGKKYILTFDVVASSGLGSFDSIMGFGSSSGSVSSYTRAYTAGSYHYYYTADSSSVYVTVGLPSTSENGDSITLDNISVTEVEEDRSVNGNGLQVFGTVTKNPVATGADLVGYSGFSTSNYLEQPYNSDLDWGTSDFVIMGWENHSTTASQTLINIGDVGSNNSFDLRVQNNVYNAGYLNVANAFASDYSITPSAPSGTWNHVAVVHTGGLLHFYVNGVHSGSWTDSSINWTTHWTTRQVIIGLRGELTTPANATSMALWRISATAPSPEQIAKIYEDEKVLFQENAQATLYGSSDAVTALAYDDTTELLHVGTSAGRSDFQGLRRVNNTTNAVGAAISASNGMIVEE